MVVTNSKLEAAKSLVDSTIYLLTHGYQVEQLALRNIVKQSPIASPTSFYRYFFDVEELLGVLCEVLEFNRLEENVFLARWNFPKINNFKGKITENDIQLAISKALNIHKDYVANALLKISEKLKNISKYRLEYVHSDEERGEVYRKVNILGTARPPMYRVERVAQSNNSIIIAKVIEHFTTLTPELMELLKKNFDDIDKINPYVFEQLVAELMVTRGFSNVQLVGRNMNTSADIFATKVVDDVGEHKYFVEVKRLKSDIGVEIIDKVYGAMISERPEQGCCGAILVSTSNFKKFKKYTPERLQNMGVYLKSRDDLNHWIKDYEQNENGLYLPK